MGVGERICGGLAAMAGVAMFVVCMADLFAGPIPPASWLNGWQAGLMGGSYYPQLTVIVLVGLAVAPFALLSLAFRSQREAAEAERTAELARKLARKPFQGRIEAQE